MKTVRMAVAAIFALTLFISAGAGPRDPADAKSPRWKCRSGGGE